MDSLLLITVMELKTLFLVYFLNMILFVRAKLDVYILVVRIISGKLLAMLVSIFILNAFLMAILGLYMENKKLENHYGARLRMNQCVKYKMKNHMLD